MKQNHLQPAPRTRRGNRQKVEARVVVPTVLGLGSFPRIDVRRGRWIAEGKAAVETNEAQREVGPNTQVASITRRAGPATLVLREELLRAQLEVLRAVDTASFRRRELRDPFAHQLDLSAPWTTGRVRSLTLLAIVLCRLTRVIHERRRACRYAIRTQYNHLGCT